MASVLDLEFSDDCGENNSLIQKQPNLALAIASLSRRSVGQVSIEAWRQAVTYLPALSLCLL